jgi:ABC-2 type transport system ATP-binding protein
MKPPADGISVRAENLEKHFGSFVAVDKVSFDVRRGEIFGFLGPNGAGKSTTIRMLCGILAPSGGRGTVAGFDIATESESVKAHIGYMSQRFSLYEDLTVEENIHFFAGIYGLKNRRRDERARWVLEMAGLADHRHRRTATLPGGWKQRLALGCALLHEPPIVFLDEPTSGVDPINRRQFWDLIHRLSDEGVTVFVTTHYMDEAEYCHRIALIYRGELIALGVPARLKSEMMSDDVVEIVSSDPIRTMDVIAGLPGVRETALFGQSVHAVVADAAETGRVIRRALAEQGQNIRGIEPIVPSMEDMFVSLIEARDRAQEEPPEVNA